MNSRRKFIKAAALTGIAGIALRPFNLFASSNKVFSFQSRFIKIELARNKPAFVSLTIDNLGREKISTNPVTETNEAKNTQFKSRASHDKISYWIHDQAENTLPAWKVTFNEKSIAISSHYNKENLPFNLAINPQLNHATVLGLMKEKNEVAFPCLIHLPDMGTLRVSSSENSSPLWFDAKRYTNPQSVTISFPAATQDQTQVSYQLEVVAIHPALPSIDDNPLYDGFRSGFINTYQMNPRLRVLANNSASDPCAFTLYKFAEMAVHTPPLADGLTAFDLVRTTLDRYLGGMKAYGLVGFTDNYEGADTVAWKSPYNSLDSYPSMLMAACLYSLNQKDWEWSKRNYDKISAWAQELIKQDKGNTGLIKHPESGNSGSWKGQRPANWWDTIGFGHEDAYSNALAYKAFLLFAEVSSELDFKKESEFFLQKAARLKAVYYDTFYNPSSGILAGWRSADGKLHDYYFTFVNGIAITYGLIDDDEGNAVMDRLLAKMKDVGYTNFGLGLPGNLIPIRREDYTHLDKRWGGPETEDGSDAFQRYENGGATACYAYFTIQALYKLGRKKEAETILFPMLESFAKGKFQGKGTNGMTYDWKDWQGNPHGYEGFLADGYMTHLAVLSSVT